ncbi:MAG: hypothetical protein JKY31_05815 [Rhodobacteraceae bacterium]|nr:hypothetical protein [Paracoccaceae bacterium]
MCAASVYLNARSRPQGVEQLSLHDLRQFVSQGRRQGWQLQDIDGTSMRAQGHVRVGLESGEALRDADHRRDGHRPAAAPSYRR